MKIQMVSDLHLDVEDLVLKNAGADVLILAGDIVEAHDLRKFHRGTTDTPSGRPRRYHEFFQRVTGEWENVIMVAGNHEFYKGRWAGTLDFLSEYAAAHYRNLHFLEKSQVNIKGVDFIGGTMWTDMKRGDPLTLYDAGSQMNDYRMIRNDSAGYRRLWVSDTVVRHRETVKYIESCLGDPTPKVVVTHHAPSFQSISRDLYHGSNLNGAYASDLSDLILDHPDIHLWVHGHVHTPNDYMIGSTRVVSNPRGYSGYEETGWDPEKFVEL